MELGFLNNFSDGLYNKMTEYINEKYKSDNFTFVRPFGGSLGSSFVKILVRSDKYPELPVCIMTDTDDENDIYCDNYLAVKYNDMTFNTVFDILKGLYGDKVFLCYQASKLAFTEGSNDNMSFEDFTKELTSSIDFTAIVEYDTSKEDASQITKNLKEALCAKGVSCCGKIYYANDGADLSELTFQNYYYKYLEKKTYDASFSFVLDIEDGYRREDWQVLNNAD